MEHEEYTTYPCCGKKYNGEKAIISLTSWKARINDVSKTLFSLIKTCQGFHIVLVLSEEEFPQKEKELPETLLLFVNNNLIELLWTKLNLFSHKKYFYTMQKYKNVPIILADDDLTYVQNFAELLYDVWKEHQNSIVCCRAHNIRFLEKRILPYRYWDYETLKPNGKSLFFTSGGGVIFPPNCLKISNETLQDIEKAITADDVLLNALALKYDIPKINLHKHVYVERKENIKTGLAQLNTCGQNLNDIYIQNF